METTFQEQIKQGVPSDLPSLKQYDFSVNHAPKRKEILTADEKKLALKNALRYFPKEQHGVLAEEFLSELLTYGRIYMHRYRPDYQMFARPISEYPGNSFRLERLC